MGLTLLLPQKTSTGCVHVAQQRLLLCLTSLKYFETTLQGFTLKGKLWMLQYVCVCVCLPLFRDSVTLWLGQWGGRVIACNSITLKFESAGRQQPHPTDLFYKAHKSILLKYLEINGRKQYAAPVVLFFNATSEGTNCFSALMNVA